MAESERHQGAGDSRGSRDTRDTRGSRERQCRMQNAKCKMQNRRCGARAESKLVCIMPSREEEKPAEQG